MFLDEIQACPKAITALKSLTLDKKFDVILSRSLLGVNYNHVSSFPVGYIKRLKMFSMDFEEYLWARNIDDKIIKGIYKNYKNKKQVPALIHQEMMKLFVEYIVVGGMPEVVKTFVKTNDFTKVIENQKVL